jgi:CheY-like chemotaxis protein
MAEKDPENLTVLIVEDAEDTRSFMRLELEQLGYLVHEAEDGAKAVEIALREHPDIILMDLSLPFMDGLSATAMIRNEPKMSKVLIIAVTAYPQTDLRAEAKASGFDAYVTKPIDIPWLDELIKGLLV